MNSTPSTYGTLLSPPAFADALSHQRFQVDAQDLAAFWRRCSLSSDFWAKYSSLFVPTSVPAGWLKRPDAESTFSYLLNELFENTAKFSRGPVQEVVYEAWIFADHLVFQLSNFIHPEDQAGFTSLITELLEKDPEELYFKKLEANAESDETGSGLGYLTLIKDYGIQFGFRFQPVNEQSLRVEVQAKVDRKEM